MMRHVSKAALLSCGLLLSPCAGLAQSESAPPDLTEILARSDAQDPYAMAAHAMLLLDGTYLPYDAAQAGRLAQASAAAGNRQGKLLMVVFLEHGVGMAPDPARAAQLLEEVADSGLPDALYMRAMDRAIDDPDAALTDLRLAGAQGHVPSLQVLATLRSWDEMDAATAPAGTTPPADAPPATGSTPDRNVIIALQAMLGQLDLFKGVPTGEMGADTITAIVLYQVAHGLPTDGQPSPALRDHVAQTLAQSR